MNPECVNLVQNHSSACHPILLTILFCAGLTLGQVANFGLTRNFSGDSYLKYNEQVALPAFEFSLCLRLSDNNMVECKLKQNCSRFNLNLEQGDVNWLFSYSVSSNPDKMNICE